MKRSYLHIKHTNFYGEEEGRKQPEICIKFQLKADGGRIAALDKVVCSNELRCNAVTTMFVITPAQIAGSYQLRRNSCLNSCINDLRLSFYCF